MLTLFSYPTLYGVADNNPFGLKIFAFLRLAGLAFHHEHIFDASTAPRGQLPYINDDGTVVGDSDTIIRHLIGRHGLTIDDGLSEAQRRLTFCISRVLDDLYWVMSYSRWKDDRFWPIFRDEMLSSHSVLSVDDMEVARAYNLSRYRYQGIGRYEPDDVYKRGLADLEYVSSLVGPEGFLFGSEPHSADASLYGFVANSLFYPIDTPLRRFILSQPHLCRHCHAIHDAVTALALPEPARDELH